VRGIPRGSPTVVRGSPLI